MQMEENDEINENRIKFLENILTTYLNASKGSGVRWDRKEETLNEALDKLSELYKKRKKK